MGSILAVIYGDILHIHIENTHFFKQRRESLALWTISTFLTYARLGGSFCHELGAI